MKDLFKKSNLQYGFFECKHNKKSFKNMSKHNLTLMRELGLEIINIKGVSDSGHSAYYAGYLDLADECIIHNKALFKENKIDCLISNCPHCIDFFRKKYGYEAKHVFEILHENAHKIRNIKGIIVDYHHACYLDRLGISAKQVENFLKKIGIKVNNIISACCGSVGEDFERNFPSIADNICKKNIKKGQKLITLCPYCINMFKKNDYEVLELAELLNEI